MNIKPIEWGEIKERRPKRGYRDFDRCLTGRTHIGKFNIRWFSDCVEEFYIECPMRSNLRLGFKGSGAIIGLDAVKIYCEDLYKQSVEFCINGYD